MSLPQTEDGFTRLANELLDAIIRFDFTKRQYAVLLSVVRKTYGYNKKADALSIYQISVMTGIDRADTSRAVAELHAMNVLTKAETGRMAHGQIVPEISINKDYETWLTVGKSPSVVTDAKTPPVVKHHQWQNTTNTDGVLPTPPVVKHHTHKDNYTKDIKDRGFDPKKQLLEDGVDSEFVDAFLAIRKAKKKPLTLIAYNAMRREATKAGWSMAEAVQVVCENIWQGFKAEYVAGKPKPAPTTQLLTHTIEEVRSERQAFFAAAKARQAYEDRLTMVYPEAMQA